MLRAAACCLLVSSLAAAAVPTRAQRFDVGVRGLLTASDGEPANDIPGFGLFGRYRIDRLGDRWALAVAVDRTEYDFEEPARLLGLRQSQTIEPVDTVAEATILSASIERRHLRPGGRLSWFWAFGLGLASVDVPAAAGPLAGDGSFDIHTEVDTELLALASGGFRRALGRRAFFECALRLDQHFADWQVTDRVSGARGTVGDYLAYGGHLGLGLSF